VEDPGIVEFLEERVSHNGRMQYGVGEILGNVSESGRVQGSTIGVLGRVGENGLLLGVCRNVGNLKGLLESIGRERLEGL